MTFDSIFSHVKENMPSYIIASLLTMALFIANSWVRNLEKSINDATCSYSKINLDDSIDRIKAMAIETPTEYVNSNHPAIQFAKEISKEAKLLKAKCPDLEVVESKANQISSILTFYANKNYNGLADYVSTISEKDYIAHHFLGSSLNRLSIHASEAKTAELRETARMQLVRAWELASLKYNGLLSHVVLLKMKCNSISLNTNLDPDDKIECYRNLLGIEGNPVAVYNLARFMLEKGDEEDFGEAVFLFSRFTSMAPRNICKHDILKDPAWNALSNDEKHRDQMTAALSKLQC